MKVGRGIWRGAFSVIGFCAAACTGAHSSTPAETAAVAAPQVTPSALAAERRTEPKLGECSSTVGFLGGVSAAAVDCDRFTWRDANCRRRTIALARVGGGYLRQYSYDLGGRTRVATGTGASGFAGFGYAVSHFRGTGGTSKGRPGKFGPIFIGAHHAIYEYAFTQPIAGVEVPVTLHWMIATRRDHPLLAITYDASVAAPGKLDADIRTPYGDIAWTGDDNSGRAVISGVAWGDRYKFRTTREPLTMNSTWDYTEPNLVPHALEWANAEDAEMGLVQTQTYLQHDAGGYWLYVNWGKTSENQQRSKGQVGVMPVSWNWTYQLNQYQLCEDDPACVDRPTTSQRLAWGMNYGALGGAKGRATYKAYGDDKELVGHPYQSYSVFVVLGKHSQQPVFRQVRAIENLQHAKLEARIGRVLTHAPAGIGRRDSAPLEPAGYDARYSVWRLQADKNHAAFNLSLGEHALDTPVFVISEWDAAAPAIVKLDGRELAIGSALMSVRKDAKELWLTLPGTWTSKHELVIAAR